MANINIPPNYDYTECGITPSGLSVAAITDGMGSQVVVRGTEVHLLSHPLGTHEQAVVLANQVACKGISVYSAWTTPISTLYDFATRIVSTRMPSEGG